MLTACVESLTENLETLKEILPLHWEELALNKDKVPLHPRYDIYLNNDAEGAILFATLRSKGVLVGYYVGFTGSELHYKTCSGLRQDIFYVHPEFRGVRGGVLLFKAVENEAKRRKIQRMIGVSKCHADSSRLFDFLGYEKIETVHSKWIGE